jgi:sugar (pentulose or hexulose) kinase
MAHSNNCSSETDSWISLFGRAAEVLGSRFSTGELYDRLLGLALEADPDAGGLLSFGYLSGEHMTGFGEGRPLFTRRPESSFTLENFMRSLLFTSLCALRTGLNILYAEGAAVDEIRGHGGFFKTAEVGKRIMAAATGIPVSTLETAGEGGAWGMALLAGYMIREAKSTSLPDFLDPVFTGTLSSALAPFPSDTEGFDAYFKRYHAGLPIERAAVENI